MYRLVDEIEGIYLPALSSDEDENEHDEEDDTVSNDKQMCQDLDCEDLSCG